ncbi:hypothetical protein B0H16DRAFT_1554301 [Mycena metata]|uniref:Uncharacterized protein n=1 Tax=Mycena metata TaxID=1033252 RepID=A0AAD7IS05_9AGAR|nr:hypothetical protein B0H16DRAFT_1554301 [Mycena metata]
MLFLIPLVGLLAPCLAFKARSPNLMSLIPRDDYIPSNPGDYSGCAVDPSIGPPITMLDMDSGAPLINRGGIAVLQTTLEDDVGTFETDNTFQTYNLGAVDLAYTDSTGTYYLAIYDTGAVGYEGTSSGGQIYVPSALTGKGNYITTVWVLDCDGVLTPILDNATEYIFQYDTPSNTILAVTSDVSSTFSKRGFGDRLVKWAGDKAGGTNTHQNDGDEPRCGSGQTSSVAAGAPPSIPNGCGAANKYHPPQFTVDLTPCCNQHDSCYDDCVSGFLDCNNALHACMLNTCETTYGVNGTTPGTIKGSWCRNVADVYYDLISSISGRNSFDDAQAERCVCNCDDPLDTWCLCRVNPPPPESQQCTAQNCCKDPSKESCKCCFGLC